jgi:hypothetical protein
VIENGSVSSNKRKHGNKAMEQYPEHLHFGTPAPTGFIAKTPATRAGPHGSSSKPSYTTPAAFSNHGTPPSPHGNGKPPHSYVALIYLAMKASGRSKITLAEIYEFILYRFPYYQTAGLGWKNSIRHNLTQQKCFMKVQRLPEDGGGKGGFWAPHTSYTELLEERAAKGDSSGSSGGSARPKSSSKAGAKKRRIAATVPSRTAPPRLAVSIKPRAAHNNPSIRTSNYDDDEEDEEDEEEDEHDRSYEEHQDVVDDSEDDLDASLDVIRNENVQVDHLLRQNSPGDDWSPMPRDGQSIEQVQLQNWFGSPVLGGFGALGASPARNPPANKGFGNNAGNFNPFSPAMKRTKDESMGPMESPRGPSGFGLGVEALIGSWLNGAVLSPARSLLMSPVRSFQGSFLSPIRNVGSPMSNPNNGGMSA